LKNKLFLSAILLFSFFLYSYKLSQIPSVYVDEAVTGYNAYSILKTGKDENGKLFPIYFRFFNAYSPGLYTYSIVPLIKLFGLNPFSVRLLSVFSGVVSVYIFYRLVFIFLKSEKKSLITTSFYAILPWTIFNSRLGYEVMYAAAIFNTGAYLVFKLLPNISNLGLLLISLSTYASHNQRYLAPLFIIGYFIIIKTPKIKTLLMLLISQIPNLILMFTPAFWVKNSIFSLKYILLQIITYISPKTLFFELPDIDLQHQIPKISLLYWWMIIPLVTGLKKLTPRTLKEHRLLIFWAIISLVPASLSGEFISIQRALPFLFPISLIISLGLSQINRTLLLIAFPYSLALFLRSYFIFLPKELALSWNEGYRQLSEFSLSHGHETILVDNSRNIRNYILPLFYQKYDPTLYQQSLGKSISSRYYQVPPQLSTYHYGSLTFAPIDWSQIENYDYIVSDSLSVSSDQAREHNLVLFETILTQNHQISQEIYKVVK
jgi:4-amino-4-deoxy-L-arabinose transferase-like glycosyltransferase